MCRRVHHSIHRPAKILPGRGEPSCQWNCAPSLRGSHADGPCIIADDSVMTIMRLQPQHQANNLLSIIPWNGDAPCNIFRFFLLWLCIAIVVDSCNRVLSPVLCRLSRCIFHRDVLRATDAGMVSVNPYNAITNSDNRNRIFFLQEIWGLSMNELNK